MRPDRSLLTRLVLGCVPLAAVAPDAAAYIDPGTGSLLLQAAIGAIAAAGIAFRARWSRLISRMRRKRRRADDRGEDGNEADDAR